MSQLQVQPQVTQLRREYAQPLMIDDYVDRFIDLIGLNTSTNFRHKRVWVRELETEYYLKKGNGSNQDDWEAVIAKTTIPEYDVNKTYQKDDVVMVRKSGKLYKAIDNNVIGKNPVRFPRLWQPITGDIEEFRREFRDQSVVIIAVPQANPIFRVFQTEIVSLDDGSEEEHHYEIDCVITETTEKPNLRDELTEEDLETDIEADDNEEDLFFSKSYKFEFFEDGKPATISGVIVCK